MELKHEKITQYIPAIFLVVVNGDIKSKRSSSLLCSDLVCVHVNVCSLQRKKQARRKTHI